MEHVQLEVVQFEHVQLEHLQLEHLQRHVHAAEATGGMRELPPRRAKGQLPLRRVEHKEKDIDKFMAAAATAEGHSRLARRLEAGLVATTAVDITLVDISAGHFG